MFHRARAWLADAALRRARQSADAAGAERWLRRACFVSPAFGPAHQAAVLSRVAAEDRLGGLAVAERAASRFAQDAGAWVLLGEAREAAFRLRDALVAHERALMIEERPDAAMAAGRLYRRLGDHITAGARFARAYAAGAGPDALRENAIALRATGDGAAASEAIAMWEAETGRTWMDDRASRP